MIVGMGTDIVKVSRFKHWFESSGLLERFFHAEEVSRIRSTNSLQTAAGRYAAKEAFVKALGTGFCGLSLKDICTVNTESGKPVMRLFGEAQQAFIKSGAQILHVSISHEKEYACAIVILESI